MPDNAPTPDPDGLAAKIVESVKAALGRKLPGSDDDSDLYRDKAVPYDRYATVARERAEYRAALEAVTADLTTYKTQTAATVDEIKRQQAKALKDMEARHTEDLTLTDLGMRDPDGREALRSAWSKMPEGERPKTPAELWKGIVEGRAAHLADPEKVAAPAVPRTLVGWLPEAPAPAQTSSSTTTQTTGRLPPTERSVAPPPRKLTAADIQALAVKARGGDADARAELRRLASGD